VKNRPFLSRLRFACQGIGRAIHEEASLRAQLAIAALGALILALLRPPLAWVLACLAAAAAVLAAELFNTALERLADRLHPEIHPAVEMAKDCAAGAVLILAITAAIIGATTVGIALHWI
jgi:undecaprenol kinase